MDRMGKKGKRSGGTSTNKACAREGTTVSGDNTKSKEKEKAEQGQHHDDDDDDGDDTKLEEVPFEISEDEYQELIGQVSQLSQTEAEEEWLECCRYGEVDAARALLGKFPALCQYQNPNNGNTGLHMAAANGHLSVAKLLIRHGHIFVSNHSGNTPLHWAASNGKPELVELFTRQKQFEVDVLEKNNFGRSALTEGFTSQDESVVKSLLEHDSATEDKLLSVKGGTSTEETVHKFFDEQNPLLVRELAIANADNPFADTDRPDQDTTGFSIWSAALVLARWMKTKSWDGVSVLELGSGCGVPGLAIASAQPPPGQVYVTDLNPKTVQNLEHNIDINGLQKNTKASIMDWSDKATWPNGDVQYVIGSDLVYQKTLVPLLVSVILGTLRAGGKFFYVAPDSGRDGLNEFIEEMKKHSHVWEQQVAPKEYTSNPLTSNDDEECFLHFQELSSLTYILYEFTINEQN